ncbi:MAG: arsenite oxidase large subunit, partial [Myxococcota bacterium]
AAEHNAVGADYPVPPFGPWISPQMVNQVTIDGRPHHIVVMPDHKATVVNPGGDHTLGASLAQRLYNPNTPTADRFKSPMLRVDGELVPISWSDATDLVAHYSRFVLTDGAKSGLTRNGPLAWGMKTYSYQFYENTYAITKLAFEAVQTPCWAPHDKAAEGSDTPGLSDAGINVFSAAYSDWRDAEVVFCSGVSLYDAHGVLFSQWVKGPDKHIVVNPRRDPTADYALANGGMFLQIKPGTDTALHNAIARVIIQNGWQDAEFLRDWVASNDDILVGVGDWRRRRHSVSVTDYVTSILSDSDCTPEAASVICGISVEDIREAATRMAKPREDGTRPRTSLMLEKGNYWGHNYPNTASFSSLGLLVGAGNRPGQMISRAGGHQRGMIKAAPYPDHLSPHNFEGNPIGLNLDHWTLAGELAFVWVIGCTWAGGGGAASTVLFNTMRRLCQDEAPGLTADVALPGGEVDVQAVIGNWQARARAGGMVIVQQDLYPQRLTELADLVLPAAGWGEDTFSRMQGERRLRLYPKLADAPGEARSDWRIIAEVAKKMGYSGFDWTDTVQLFEEAGLHSSGPHAYRALLEYAADNRLSARQVLRERGTTGLQCPLVYEDGELKETVRYHDAEAGRAFSTPSGRAHMVWAPWSDVIPRQVELAPLNGELWIINRRHSSVWSSMVEDQRVPFRRQQLPENWLEMHPQDAAERGISDGDSIIVERTAKPVGAAQSGGWPGQFNAVAQFTDRLARGVACAYFNYGGEPSNAANNVISGSSEPMTNKNAFKLGRGQVRLA